MTGLVTTHADFAEISWHDNHLYGLSVQIGDFEANDWRHELIFDIDHITEWVKGDDDVFRFRVAPAKLIFHDVTDANIAINWGECGQQTAIHEVSIDFVEQQQIEDQKICLDRPYYRWRIAFNWPAGSEVTFGASGFTQTLRGEPVLSEMQHLTVDLRAQFGDAG